MGFWGGSVLKVCSEVFVALEGLKMTVMVKERKEGVSVEKKRKEYDA